MVNCNHQILMLPKDQEDKTGMENMWKMACFILHTRTLL